MITAFALALLARADFGPTLTERTGLRPGQYRLREDAGPETNCEQGELVFNEIRIVGGEAVLLNLGGHDLTGALGARDHGRTTGPGQARDWVSDSVLAPGRIEYRRTAVLKTQKAPVSWSVEITVTEDGFRYEAGAGGERYACDLIRVN